jgi:hypothetical protein
MHESVPENLKGFIVSGAKELKTVDDLIGKDGKLVTLLVEPEFFESNKDVDKIRKALLKRDASPVEEHGFDV